MAFPLCHGVHSALPIEATSHHGSKPEEFDLHSSAKIGLSRKPVSLGGITSTSPPPPSLANDFHNRYQLGCLGKITN